MSTSDTATGTATGTIAPPAPGRWVIDPAHSSIEAIARHMMVSKVRGRFESFSGTVEVGEDPTESAIDISIDAKSINTNEEQRDQHLRSADFLDADEHPQLTFTSTRIEHVEGDSYRVIGELTIRGETHPVELDVDYFGVNTDPFGSERALFQATTKLNREDWDMTWNQALETGGVLVGKKLDVAIDVQLVPAEDQG
jgi:polyisoprenoid-binding protein YceI